MTTIERADSLAASRLVECARARRFKLALSTASERHVTDRAPAVGPNRQWIERIKGLGNDANHELNPIEPDVALDLATFTEQVVTPRTSTLEWITGRADPSFARCGPATCTGPNSTGSSLTL
jgi:hypothetical protein